jgi:hypothetical protein
MSKRTALVFEAKKLTRKLLNAVATIVTPQTLLHGNLMLRASAGILSQS